MNYNYFPLFVLSIVLSTSYYLGYTPPFISLIFIFASILTYFFYAKDKKAARNNQWRTPESTLHLCSLLFGWPGAIVAQQKLRHKSKKLSFRIILIITIVINSSLIAAMHSNDGVRVLRNFTYELQHFVTTKINNQQLNRVAIFLLEFRQINIINQQNANFYVRKSKQ